MINDLHFEDSDEENSEASIILKQKRRWLRDASNPLELANVEFIRCFRVNKEAFIMILSNIDSRLKERILNTSVPNILKLAASLRFFAEGGYQRGTGNDLNIACSQPTMSRIIHEVCDAMETLICPQWINFHYTEEEKLQAKLYFFEKCKFPGVIGAIDGTHIAISNPALSTQHLYYNRKGFHSLNVMLVCDHLMRIRFVDARYPGATHDSIIFKMSELYNLMRGNFQNGDTNTWLLGDSGYALEPFLITPFRDAPTGSVEKRFNDLHAKGRNIIERTNGVLKNRFRCILGERVLHYQPESVKQIVNTRAALNNICIYYKLDSEQFEDAVQDDLDEDDMPEIDDCQKGCRIRNQILQSLIEQNN